MNFVRKKILKEWDFNNGNNNDITQRDLERLFDLYDEYAFYGGIKEHIARKQNIKITFGNLSPEKGDEPANRYCGITKYIFIKGVKKEIILNLELSAWIISRIVHTTPPYLIKLTSMDLSIDMTRSEIISYIDIVKYAYLQAFEHQLTHLLFYLWGHSDHQDTEKNIHSNLFNCVYSKFFETSVDIVQNMMVPNSKDDTNFYPQPLIMKKSFYKYHENSCYLDSLLMVLLFTKSNVFRNTFFTTNIDIIYQLQNTFTGICSQDSSIKSFKDFNNFIKDFQGELFHDYMNMFTSETNTKCKNIRNLLVECLPDISEGMRKNVKNVKNVWSIYNVSEIYNFITNIFPSLKGKEYPYIIIPTGNEGISPPNSVFTFWEFMEIPDIKEIIWEGIDNDILVFRNGGIPAITDFGSITSEDISIPTKDYGSRELSSHLSEDEFPSGELHSDGDEELITINKSKVFGETILNGKYEMIGAIMLNGISPG